MKSSNPIKSSLLEVGKTDGQNFCAGQRSKKKRVLWIWWCHGVADLWPAELNRFMWVATNRTAWSHSWDIIHRIGTDRQRVDMMPLGRAIASDEAYRHLYVQVIKGQNRNTSLLLLVGLCLAAVRQFWCCHKTASKSHVRNSCFELKRSDLLNLSSVPRPHVKMQEELRAPMQWRTTPAHLRVLWPFRLLTSRLTHCIRYL